MSLVCWEKEHMRIVLMFALPAIIVWVFGFPLMIFFILRRHRHSLNTNDTIIKYGLYYIGFRDETYFWQIIVIYLKRILYIAVSVSM